jgi:hypothetical protein
VALGTSPGYILRSPHTLALPSSRTKLRNALNSSKRGVHFAGFGDLGVAPTPPITDQQYDASADAPGTSKYMRVDTLQCALNIRGLPALVVDGRWGPRTAANFSTFVQTMRENPPPPPASISDYVYTHPSAGVTMISMTNALHDALMSGIDTSNCVVAAATGRSPGQVAPHASNPGTPAPLHPDSATAAPSHTDWTTYGIAAAGAVALGVVGYAVFGKKKRKKGRR